ncbi:MAG: hypothetical protein ACF8AM_10120 [Rhodopirellula sp. JB055]|uniref:hypothetical protein n=1 Tax=Rhodopirellula sp. JB055 TaxID=3342846 RepID=UPI00370B5B2B
MKNVTIALLLAIATIASALLVRSYRENLLLKSEAAKLAETIESYECLVESRNENLAHSRLGTSVLCRLALSGTNNDVFNFLDMTPVGSLNCKAIDLAESPETKLLWYTQMPEYEEGKPISFKKTRALREEAKSVLFIVDVKSFSIVDHVMINDFTGVSGGGRASSQYKISCNLPNGTPVEYTVLPTGFERSQ